MNKEEITKLRELRTNFETARVDWAAAHYPPAHVMYEGGVDSCTVQAALRYFEAKDAYELAAWDALPKLLDEVERLQTDSEMADGCLNMVCDVLSKLDPATDPKKVPPMMYDTWVAILVAKERLEVKRLREVLKEIQAFAVGAINRDAEEVSFLWPYFLDIKKTALKALGKTDG